VGFHIYNDYVKQLVPIFQSTKTSGGLTKCWDDPKTARATAYPTFHTWGREDTKFEKGQPPKNQAAPLGLTFR
jgi:hypothetical protein